MLPFAISAPGWTAIGAIGGALVGATAGGVVDAAIFWRRDARLAQAGSRLLAAQLKTADAILYTVEQEGVWVRFYELSMSAWPEYRSLLASKLKGNDFEVIADCVPALAKFSEDMQTGRDWEPDSAGVRLPTPAIERLAHLRSGAAKAYNALADLAGHDQVDERINP
jgi:hypothetical protein